VCCARVVQSQTSELSWFVPFIGSFMSAPASLLPGDGIVVQLRRDGAAAARACCWQRRDAAERDRRVAATHVDADGERKASVCSWPRSRGSRDSCSDCECSSRSSALCGTYPSTGTCTVSAALSRPLTWNASLNICDSGPAASASVRRGMYASRCTVAITRARTSAGTTGAAYSVIMSSACCMSAAAVASPSSSNLNTNASCATLLRQACTYSHGGTGAVMAAASARSTRGVTARGRVRVGIGCVGSSPSC
jgi:hypothetical protein